MSTEDRPLPPAVRPGDRLALGPLRATVVRALAESPAGRGARFRRVAPGEIWEGLARHGRPIQYSHVAVAADALGHLDADSRSSRRIRVALGRLRAGLGGHRVHVRAGRGLCDDHPCGGHLVDRRSSSSMPCCHSTSRTESPPRRWQPSRRLAIAADASSPSGRRSCGHWNTRVSPTEPSARRRSRDTRGSVPRVGSVWWTRFFPGTHEPGTSHYELLRAFVDDSTLLRIDEELNARGYQTHEFGDSVFLERAASKRSVEERAAA